MHNTLEWLNYINIILDTVHWLRHIWYMLRDVSETQSTSVFRSQYRLFIKIITYVITDHIKVILIQRNYIFHPVNLYGIIVLRKFSYIWISFLMSPIYNTESSGSVTRASLIVGNPDFETRVSWNYERLVWFSSVYPVRRWNTIIVVIYSTMKQSKGLIFHISMTAY
jgi:hypothetical protein